MSKRRRARGAESAEITTKVMILKPAAPVEWWIKEEGYSGVMNKGEQTGIRAGVTLVQQPSKAALAQELAALGVKPDAEREPEFAKLVAALTVVEAAKEERWQSDRNPRRNGLPARRRTRAGCTRAWECRPGSPSR